MVQGCRRYAMAGWVRLPRAFVGLCSVGVGCACVYVDMLKYVLYVCNIRIPTRVLIARSPKRVPYVHRVFEHLSF